MAAVAPAFTKKGAERRANLSLAWVRGQLPDDVWEQLEALSRSETAREAHKIADRIVERAAELPKVDPKIRRLR
ncbi:MAG: hypothetical protein OXH75_15635 [Acidobacteria bacterium]|nr:hypothetical protein [Acidobacteriota bacterium]